jgi:hypothetical protein
MRHLLPVGGITLVGVVAHELVVVQHEERFPDGCLLCDNQCWARPGSGRQSGGDDVTYAVVRDLKSSSQCSVFTNLEERCTLTSDSRLFHHSQYD